MITSPFAAHAAVPRPEWSIGIYVGRSPWDFTSPTQVDNPVLTRQDVTDVPAAFVADPFMLRTDHTWYMFFEVVNAYRNKGEIGLAQSEDGLKWSYQQIVLAEPFHLSYPYVFAWNGEYYMIPESHQAGAVRLYHAQHFPHQWAYVTTLLHGSFIVDASVVHYDNTWWLFAETNPDAKYDTLRLYYATHLPGPWREHPQSPIVAGNPHIARPAGRMVVVDDRVIRYTQDCSPFYGLQVRAFAITTLTTTRYQERACSDHPVLTGQETGWNAVGMHHIDPHALADGTWRACVDGFVWHTDPVLSDTERGRAPDHSQSLPSFPGPLPDSHALQP
jgi:hypothetical protein